MMKKGKWKIISAAIIAAIILPTLSGCNKKSAAEENKTVITVGDWPTKDSSSYKSQEKIKEDFMKKYPDIVLKTDSYGYSIDTFAAKAAAKQLPTIFRTWFTEVDRLVDGGNCADVTEMMEKYGYLAEMNPDLLELVTRNGGRIYGIPKDAYAQGLYINKNMFRQAGLVNDDGSIKIPDTYEDILEFSKIIKEKTGYSGFALPNGGNNGGWHLVNIAWSNGVEFCEQTDDGKWRATFDTPEFKQTLQWLYDLKWKYDAFPLDLDISRDNLNKMFAVDQVAMMFADPPNDGLVRYFGMKKEDIMAAKMPKGTKDRVSQMGGNLYMIRPDATLEQMDACFKWLDFIGASPKLNDESIANMKSGFKDTIDNNGIVLDQSAFDLWVSSERVEKEKEIRKEFTNVDHKDYEDYYSFEGVKIRPEVPVCCQELYSVLDKCIQEIQTNENVNLDALIKKSVGDWQKNYLDNIK